MTGLAVAGADQPAMHPPPSSRPTGECPAHHNAHWTVADLRKAVEMLDRGIDFWDIAEALGVSYRRVENRLRQGRINEVRAIIAMHPPTGTEPPLRVALKMPAPLPAAKPAPAPTPGQRHPLDIAEEKWATFFAKSEFNYGGRIVR